jgi:ATP-dependent helicase HrpB
MWRSRSIRRPAERRRRDRLGSRSEASSPRARRLGALVLDRKPIAAPDPQALARAMAEGIRQLGPSSLPWTPDARAIQAGLAFLRGLDPERGPEVSVGGLALDPLAWLGDNLGGITRRAHLARIDVAAALLDRLDWIQRRDLDLMAPTHIDVPTGRA